jgi:hypothetical protein
MSILSVHSSTKMPRRQKFLVSIFKLSQFHLFEHYGRVRECLITRILYGFLVRKSVNRTIYQHIYRPQVECDTDFYDLKMYLKSWEPRERRPVFVAARATRASPTQKN